MLTWQTEQSTATSYPVDKQHVGVEDRELARGHWAGAPDNSYVRDSTIKYGDPTSGFYEPPTPPAPPPPADTQIGAVIVSGETAPLQSFPYNYTATTAGATASGLSYEWSSVGGAVTSTNGATCEVQWFLDGAGSVTCTVSSSDPGVTDSPQSDTLNVTVSAHERGECQRHAWYFR